MTRRLFWTENGLLLRFVQNYLYIRNFIGICIPSYTDVIVANINKIQRCNRSVFWNISDGVIFLVFLLHFGTVPTMWYFLFFCYILEQFRWCDIFLFFCCMLEQCRRCDIFLFSYYIFELLRQCGIFAFIFLFLTCFLCVLLSIVYDLSQYVYLHDNPCSYVLSGMSSHPEMHGI